jgi:transketolase
VVRDAFVKSLGELADADPDVILINGDLGFGVLNDYIRDHPTQYVNAGVAEQNMTGMAAGMALEGARAYTYSIANFTTLRCLEQLRNDVCYHEANVTAVAIGGGFSYGQLGMSHFATEDLAIMRALPGMTVVAPSDPWQAIELTRQMYRRAGPGYLRIDKDQAGLPAAPDEIELGKVRVVRRGADATVFTAGAILVEALAAAETLAAEGIELTLVDVHTIKPFDAAGVVAAASATGVVVTLEEHTVVGGLGSAVAEALLEAGAAPKAFRRLGVADLYPSIVGDQRFLRAAYGLDAVALASAVREALGRNG